MTAVYNEIEPYAAEWMENLERAGHIAPGRVDRRDIREVQPGDVAGATQFHAFAGIGVWSHALRLAGWPDRAPVWTGSCPCQPFSAAGKRKGFADERHLWPEWLRLIRECGPSVLFGEQVGSVDGRRWFDVVSNDLEGLGYAVGAASLPACGVGAPHLRQRLYFVAYSACERFDRVNSLHERREEVPKAPGGGALVGLANAAGRQRGDGQPKESRQQESSPRGYGVPGSLANPQNSGPIQGGDPETRATRPSGARPADPGVMGDTGSTGGRRHPGTISCTEGEGEGEGGRARNLPHELVPPDSTCGFWAGAEWIPCKDGKWRATKSGLQPLAPRSPGRVGKLRAIGNSIVPQVAATFVRAFMESVER